jgi:hypothetical protein
MDPGSLPLRGRQGELGVIEDRLREVSAEAGGAIVFEGSAGAGKTKLVDASMELARGLGFRVGRGALKPYREVPPSSNQSPSDSHGCWRAGATTLSAVDPRLPRPLRAWSVCLPSGCCRFRARRRLRGCRAERRVGVRVSGRSDAASWRICRPRSDRHALRGRRRSGRAQPHRSQGQT